MLVLINYIFLPLDTQTTASIQTCNWINLLTYVATEQLFVLTFRRLSARTTCLIGLASSSIYLYLSTYQAAVLALAQEKHLLLPIVVDAATNAGALIAASKISDRTLYQEKFATNEIAALTNIGVFTATRVAYSSTATPFNMLLSTGTWEQARLLCSYLVFRFTAGAPLQSLMVGVTSQNELRLKVASAGDWIEAEEEYPTENLYPDEKGIERALSKRPLKAAANLNILFIMSAACIILPLGLILSIAFAAKYWLGL